MNSSVTCTQLLLHDGKDWSVPNADASEVGCKAVGIAAFPPEWRPPLAVLSTATYRVWLAAEKDDQPHILMEAAQLIFDGAKKWDSRWSSGIILRSSASSETMNDRGQHQSLRIARDFSRQRIFESLQTMFYAFATHRSTGVLAVMIQPIVKGKLGHLSNERRMSKSINHWDWEQVSSTPERGRINSQRDSLPLVSAPLKAQTAAKAERLFGSVGQWVNGLKRGPAHLEWAYDGERLWLLQLDFENEMPDTGVDPKTWFRDMDHNHTPTLTSQSPFQIADTASDGPWRKISNVHELARHRHEPFPQLVSLTGTKLLQAIKENYDLESDLERFANGRVVCRTDCVAVNIKRENLPRTPTESSAGAIDAMKVFLSDLQDMGAKPEEVCFILHKFIPAQVGAWAKAEPGNPIVKIDSLWGVPDGLQYLPHDTFEFDVGSETIVSDRIRFKPKFIQEDSDGNWRLLSVRRSLGRSRSLAKADVHEVALISHQIARELNQSVLIMWFCGIPNELGIGRNLPWFRMKPNPAASILNQHQASRWPRRHIRTAGDIDDIPTGLRKHILVLDPEVGLIRDDKRFLERISVVAKNNGLPVEIAGSALAHAYYMLEKEGITVLPADDSTRRRSRGRRTFDKLVRDNLTTRIQQHGEVVIRSKLLRSEMRQALVAKLFEEAHELLSAQDPEDVKAEIADLLEVVRALSSATGVAWADVEQSAEAKRVQRGGFETGEVLVETTRPSVEPIKAHAPPVVSLRQLGRVVNHGSKSEVSFNALLASAVNGAEIFIGGQSLKVTLLSSGIEVARVSKEAPGSRQLRLDLDD